MSRFAPLTLIAAAAALALTSAPAQAQSYGHHASHGYGHDRQSWRAPSWWSQRDRPGDYRCDAFWDANRTDCHERWRDQRPAYARHGGGYVHYGRGRGYGGHDRYGHAYDRYAGHVQGGSAWPGAYGRPDLVYPGAGRAGGRDPRRIEWCRWNYRSYDPASGYYRAYSGRLIFCG